MNKDSLPVGVEADDWDVSPLVKSVVLNARLFFIVVVTLGLVIFMSVLIKSSSAFHLDKVDFITCMSTLNSIAAAIGLSLVMGWGKGGKVTLSPKAIMRSMPLIFLLNMLFFCASAGFLAGEMQNSNWATTAAKIISISNKEVHVKRGGVIYYPRITMQYKVNGREIESTVLSETTNLDIANDRVIIYYNPNNPAEVSLSRGLLGQHYFLLFSACASLLAALGSAIKLLSWKSKLSERLHALHLKNAAGHAHATKSISADAQANGTHIHLYDPIPGTEPHEVILKEKDRQSQE